MAKLQGKVAVVTGGGSGIGLAIVERLHEEGASIVIADISGEEATVAKRLGDRAIGVHADVSNAADVQATLQTACSHFGGLDILCNNAGIDGGITLVGDVTEDQFERIMAINFRSVFLGIKYAIPLMKQRGGGSIVNTSSLASLISSRGLGVYGASKAAINSLTRSTAAEYAADNIRVNSICPGATATPLVKSLFLSNPEESAASISIMPMRRLAEPYEIAEAVFFLANPDSAIITGVSLPIDGGYSIV